MDAVGTTTTTTAKPKQHLPVQPCLCSAAGHGMVCELLTATGHGADTSPLPTQSPPAPLPRQQLGRRKIYRQTPPYPLCPSRIPPLPIYVMLLLRLYIYLYFFSSCAVSHCCLLGIMCPPTLKLGHSASAAKTPAFFSSPPPLIRACFIPYRHTFPPQAHPGSVRAGHSGACHGLGWKCETLETKPGKALKLRPQRLVLSSADVVCVRLGSRNLLRPKP